MQAHGWQTITEMGVLRSPWPKQTHFSNGWRSTVISLPHWLSTSVYNTVAWGSASRGSVSDRTDRQTQLHTDTLTALLRILARSNEWMCHGPQCVGYRICTDGFTHLLFRTTITELFANVAELQDTNAIFISVSLYERSASSSSSSSVHL